MAGAMDRETYRSLRATLTAELRAVEHSGVENQLEQLDVDTVLRFARHLLSQPERWWRDALPAEKIRLQETLFPNGLLVDRALNISTDPNRQDSITYLLFGGGANDMASHADLSWNQAIEWLRNMAALRENPVFAGDSADSGPSTSPSNTGISTP